MDDAARQGRHHTRHGLSPRAQQVLWAGLGGVIGLIVGAESASALAAGESLLGMAVGASVGALFASQLSRALPAFGVVVGPAITLTLMNLERFTTAYTVSVQPLARVRGPGQPMDSGIPSLSYLSAAIGVIASAILAAVLLHALSRKIHGERRPPDGSFRGIAWICFWITLITVLISNFAPL